MKSGSIRWRMMLAGTLAILVALALAAGGLALLFDRHVARIAEAELKSRALAVLAMVEPSGPGLRSVPLDPRYDQVFSGHYWQLRLGERLVQSRSLWDHTLPLPEHGPEAGQTRMQTLPGPQGEPLITLEQRLVVGKGDDALPLRVLVAMDRTQLDLARRGFTGDMLPWLGLLGLLLLAASYVQIRVGLGPLAQVGARVAELRTGLRPRIGSDMPSEVIPLATEIDKLLDARDHELARARHRAADLAHGFKTPLQALMGDAGQLRDKGEAEIARSVEGIAAAMRRHVDRELARARIQSDRAGAVAEPAQVLHKLIGVLRRTPLGNMIDWQVDAAPGLRARIDPDDLTEALGALLENAMRHAHETVSARVWQDAATLHIAIRDDGPGVPDADLTRLTQRGLSLDPQGEGQGIGLAVVAGVIEAAQGNLRMRNALPGLEVTLELSPA
ncbi:sensor histidine kinase [Paracoccus laeviglucosivorans]|uniref:histidine kinase n=1 Tax=Paracoccus laeviglucosivorans TaxID=1197861 RepID=A0A521B3M0_9RHOB|nr:HAMP domain-containing sensor histidine kinase [Paracoccus laeviglucosivorans]SMO41645.1 Signal transduction histidine kinase [Paracoccus laeviglucosivorans]